MLGARLGRRQAGLGRLASLRLHGWTAEALDQRLEDGALLAATVLADAGPPPSPPPHTSFSGARLAFAWAGASLNDRSSSSSLSSTLSSRSSGKDSGSAWLAVGGPAMLPVCSSPTSRLRQAAAGWSRGFANSSGSDSSSDSDSDSSSEQPVLVPHVDKRNRPVILRPELQGELAQLAAQCGVANRAALAKSVAELGPTREQGVLQHGLGVAAHLQQLGLQPAQLGRLLLRCPLLFRWPAEQRAALLFGQLMGLGLTAAEVARCFKTQPAAAGSPSFKAAIEALAEVIAAASRGKGGGVAGSSSGAALSEAERREGEQQLGQVLRSTPAAVRLLISDATKLRQGGAILLQRYPLSVKQLMSALKQNPALLVRAAEGHLLAVESALEAVLQRDGRQLVGAMVLDTPRTLGCSPVTLRKRATELLEVFTREQLKDGPPAVLLKTNPATWQLTLAVWRALGVADPAALALNNTLVLTYDWLLPSRLAKLLALQRSLGLPTAGDVVQRFAGYVAQYAPQRVAGRLLFLQQEGLLPLLVASKEEWRRERGLPPGKPSPGEPPLISVRDVATLTDAKFATAAGVSQAALQRFTAPAALASHQPYQRLLADAAAWAERLKAEHPEVARLAAARAAAAAEDAAEAEEDEEEAA